MGRTKGVKAKPAKAASKRTGDLYSQILALHTPAHAKWKEERKAAQQEEKKEAALRKRKDKTAYNEYIEQCQQARLDKKKQKDNLACAEAVGFFADDARMFPYTKGSEAAKAAVAAIDAFLLRPRNFKHGFGCKSISFGWVVSEEDYGNVFVPLNIPGWPVWPQGVTKRAVRWVSRECMKQIVDAFLDAHPEFKLDEDGDAELPCVTISDWYNSVTFHWAQEK